MKKLILLLAVVLAFAGIASSVQSANAATYPGTVPTKIAGVKNLPVSVKHGKAFTFRVVVGAKSGNARPARGHIRVWVIRGGVVRQAHDYSVMNGIANPTLKLFVKGKFKLIINYLPPRTSVWKFATTTRFVTAS